MKLTLRTLILLGATAGVSLAPAQDVTVIPRPHIADGSNQSRAPFPADRRFDDVTPANGEAIDEALPPNTEATEPPAPPAPVVAIFQSDQPAAEATLSMTGRPTVGIATSLETPRIMTAIRAQPVTARDQLFTDIESRIDAGEAALRGFRSTTREMNATNREQFETAAEDLKAKEKALRKSVKEARKANAENWEAARTQLAADYEAYAAAAARIDALAGIAPTP